MGLLLAFAAMAAADEVGTVGKAGRVPGPQAAGDEIGIRAPAGFRVELFAGDELAHDIFSMTLDAQGRVVVAGRDYVKILHDDNRDGRADRASLFSPVPASGAHGMLFLGNDLLCTGDNSLMLLRDCDGDGIAEGEPEKWAALRHPEHGANGLVRGPDGWIYLICGNDAGVTEALATTDGSPVKRPMSGAVVRFSPDGKRSEVVAHGFRNPYDLDFHGSGNLFTVDADGERDHHLPWYAPTRLFDIAQGMHHGWVLNGWQRSWNRPAYFPDNVERLVEIGRGSPTGLTVYRHNQFPPRYRDSVLSCCWTLGRVYHLPLARAGSTFTSPAKAEVFLETTGEIGFAPVDLAVGLQGELYVAIGGRRTRGSVFRVMYEGVGGQESGIGSRVSNIGGRESGSEDLNTVLLAAQPLMAWSRAIWEPLATKLGREAYVEAARDGARPVEERLRAVEVVTDLFDGLTAAEAAEIMNGARPELAARAIWSLACSHGSRHAPPDGHLAERDDYDVEALKRVVAATHDARPLVQRAAFEALGAWGGMGESLQDIVARANWAAGFVSANRRVQAAALVADSRREMPLEGKSLATLWRLYHRGRLEPSHFSAAAEAFLTAKGDRDRLAAVRLMELSLGDINTRPMSSDVYAGYTLNAEEPVIEAAACDWGDKLATAFPSKNIDLNWELARLLGMLRVKNGSLVDRLTEQWTQSTPPHQDLHYLICLSRLPGPRSAQATERTAAGLARVQLKMQKAAMFVSRNWPLRVGEAVEELVKYDSNLPAALVACDDLRIPAQSFFARSLPLEYRQAAARKLVQIVEQSGGELRWTDELVWLVASLPDDEAFSALRSVWDDFSLRDSIVAVLNRSPQAEDRNRFIEALNSAQSTTLELAAAALEALGGEADEQSLVAVMAALKQACLTPEQKSLRQALARLLIAWTGQSIAIDDPGKGEVAALYQPWFEWLAAAHHEAAVKLAALGTVDSSVWQERLNHMEELHGDAVRGRLVFERKACMKCHAGNSPLGPDLAGAAGRLSPADLLAAIVDPSKDVSPLYQTTQVVTGSGRVVTGLVVYESPDSTLVQTDPDNTVRVAGDEIIAMRKSRLSLMPSGLLNDVGDQEVADLFEYLKTLKAVRP